MTDSKAPVSSIRAGITTACLRDLIIAIVVAAGLSGQVLAAVGPAEASQETQDGVVRQGSDVSGEHAAEDGKPPASMTVEEVTVTGTRIRAPNLSSESPVTAVSDVEIKDQGTTNIENVLNELPQIHTGQSDTTSNNSTGVANVNLRGLGPTRTLVMIDGRRLGPGDPQGPQGAAADLNFIPTALVTGIDVLTGGASAVYGSDAMAGVVNFHLLRNFDGVMLNQTDRKSVV